MTRAVVAAIAVLALFTTVAKPGASASCDTTSLRTTNVLIDGDLYGYVHRGSGYVFGWSDKPVLDFPEAVRLAHLLGVKGTLQQILGLPGVKGVDFADEGSYSAFDVHCFGAYTAAYVTREHGFSRFWLQQSRLKVERGFCMPALLLPKGAIVRTKFSVPLGLAPPRFSVDRDRDGVVDRRGVFRRGGTGFPQSTRC